MRKLGAKMIYHSINTWIQFHYSVAKCDMGLTVFTILTLLMFDNKNIIFVICDCLYFLLSVAIVIGFKKCVKIKYYNNYILYNI
jgi:hypothetical protein